MNSIKVRPEQQSEVVNEKGQHRIHSQKPPGTWLQRKLYHFWFMYYGVVKMTVMGKLTQDIFRIKRRTYDPKDEIRRPGEVVVITGGPRGIANALAKKFLQLDFIVIMGCRDVNSSQKKVDEMKSSGVVSGTIHLLQLNLNSLTSTKEFAEGVLKITNRIDLLMNNAGIMITPYECTEDGYEGQFQVNYLSHFLLTLLLLPTIKRTAEARGGDGSCRIINTSSAYHICASLDFNNLEKREVYAAPKCYFDSKLCQILFTKHLEKRLQQEKANIHVFAVHPGAIPSDLWARAGIIHKVVASMLRPFMPTVENGADALLQAALSSNLENLGGSYFEGLKLTKPMSEANNEHFQELLWSRSELLCQAFV